MHIKKPELKKPSLAVAQRRLSSSSQTPCNRSRKDTPPQNAEPYKENTSPLNAKPACSDARSSQNIIPEPKPEECINTKDINSTSFNLNNDSLLDVTSISKTKDNSCCPCNKSDTSSSKVICAKCTQSWHQNCCNLKYLTPGCIKRLTEWTCPKCFICPILKPVNPVASKSEPLTVNLDNLKNHSEELKKNSSTMECLNPKLVSLESKVTELADKIEVLTKSKCCINSNEDEKIIPNTASPHIIQAPIVTHCQPQPFLKLVEDAVKPDLKLAIKQFLQLKEKEKEFQTVDNLKYLYYGDFDFRLKDTKLQNCKPPTIIQELIEKVKPLLTNKTNIINSCIIQKHEPKPIIPTNMENDNLFTNPDSEIITIWLGNEGSIVLSPTSNTSHTQQIQMKDGSAVCFSRFSQEFWQHKITPSPENSPMWSITLRHHAPYFMNSTLIIGDSNVKHLNFGNDKFQFGKWMPGRKMFAPKIEHIPEPKEMGPFRNIIFHIGINDIRFQNRRPNVHLIRQLESKCVSTHNHFPRSRIFLSTLLPTKIRYLNNEVCVFNNLLFELAEKYDYIKIIDSFSSIADSNGSLCHTLGRFDKLANCPNRLDSIHLGSRGIKILACKLKSSIIRQKTSQALPTADGYQP